LLENEPSEKTVDQLLDEAKNAVAIQ
jgi:hypothetical protein